MWILAMPPPLPFGGQVFIALLMLVLVGLLIQTIRGVPFTRQSIGFAVIAAVAGVVVLEAIPSFHDSDFHKLGLLAAVVGILSALALQPVRLESARRHFSDPLRLSALAFVSGPVLGLILASLKVLLSNVSPLDVGYTLGSFTVVGTIAGGIGAIFVAVVSASASGRSSEPDEQD